MTVGAKKVAVFGGSGFVGKPICRIGRQVGWEIVSLSKTGIPAISDPWVRGVDWLSVDLSRRLEESICSFEPDLVIWAIDQLFDERRRIIRRCFPACKWVEILPHGRQIRSQSFRSGDLVVPKPVVYDFDCPASVLQAGFESVVDLSTARPKRQLMRLEAFAMAVVRASEEGLSGTVRNSDLRRLGGSAMIQIG